MWNDIYSFPHRLIVRTNSNSCSGRTQGCDFHSKALHEAASVKQDTALENYIRLQKMALKYLHCNTSFKAIKF